MNESAGNTEFELEVLATIHEGLGLLVKAHRYAAQQGVDPWEFAVEAPTLKKTGMTPNEFRWLISQGYAEHRRECSQPGGNGRTFETELPATFNKRSCLLLTSAGLRVAAETIESPQAPERRHGYAAAIAVNGNGHVNGKPHWDPDRHEFSVGGMLVKQFKLPSPNQEAILAAFEEDGWPARIDDPLPPVQEVDPKRRLHDTIKSLNRNQKNALIRFQGDGTGEGVLWSIASDNG